MSLWWNPFRHSDDPGLEGGPLDDLRAGVATVDSPQAPVGSAVASPGTRSPVGWSWPTPDTRRPGQRRSILLVFPIFTHMLPVAFQQFARLIVVGTTYCPFDFEILMLERQLIHGAMNQAVDVVLQQHFEAMIAFDDDCLPRLWKFHDARQFQVLPRLLGLMEANRADIIAGVGYMRGYPHTTTVGRLYPEGMTAMRDQKCFKGFYWLDDLSAHEHELDDQGLLKVDFAGMPIMLIHRRVLEGIKLPAFGTIDAEGGGCTHDVYFCKKAREAGFRIVVDTNIDCGHIISAPVVNRHTRAGLRWAEVQGRENAHAKKETGQDVSTAGATESESVGLARERESDPAECGVSI